MNPLRRRTKVKGSKKETDTTKEIPLGFLLPVEFVKIKKGVDEVQGKKVVTKKIKVRWTGGRFAFIQRGKNLHHIDTEAVIWDESKGKEKGFWKLQYYEDYCEPIGKDGRPHRNPIVSMILRDEVMMQFIQIAQLILPIQITRTMAIVITIFSLFSGFMAFAIAPSVAPTTVIHWLNSPPKIVP